MTSILKYLNRALLVLLLAAFAACSDNEGGNESNGNGDDGNTETPADGDTYGYIKDTNGNPVEGVVVSDGDFPEDSRNASKSSTVESPFCRR